MFSRAAKSIVKTIGQRKYHAGEENIKLAVIGGAGEVGQSLSQMLKQTSKLDVLALYDVAALNKRYLTPIQSKNFTDRNTVANTANSRMLTMLEKSRSSKGDYRGDDLQTPYFSNRVSNANQNATEELVKSLRQLPIAEECATNQATRATMQSQGNHACANDLRGPRVLAEMGPATFQHSGRIVSEIYRQFPNFANYITKTRSNKDDVASTRRWYSNIALSFNVKNELDSRWPIAEFVPYFEKVCPRNTERISMTTKNSRVLDGTDNKSRSRKKDGKQLNVASSEQITKKKLLKDAENRAAMQRCDRKKHEARKCNEWKIVDKTTTKVEKRSSNVEKSKNWTIPAALSDKKPKMLYGLVRQRRKPLTNFFSRFFEIRNNDLADDYYSKFGGWKIDRIDCTANQKTPKESNQDKSVKKSGRRENRSNVSTSVSDLAAGSLEGIESSMIVENSRSLEQSQMRTIVQQSRENSSCEIIDARAPTTTSNSESENDTSESGSTQKMSSKIALFLENLKTNRQRSHSLSSLASYNLESLFIDVEVAPILKHPTTMPVLFSSSDSDCKSSIKNKLKKMCCKKKSRKEDEICKKGKRKGLEASKSCGKKNEPPACKKRDECKKQPTCDEDDKDPCKPCRSDEHHGPTCKKYKEEAKYDPCDKFWNDETHGPRCKKKQKKKKKKTAADTCCQRKEESYETKKKEKPKKSEKAKCPPVIRAPGCPQDDDKSGATGSGSYRRYSTFDSKINANNDSDHKDISKTDESNDVSINSQCNRQEKTRKVGLLDSNAIDVSCRYRDENC